MTAVAARGKVLLVTLLGDGLVIGVRVLQLALGRGLDALERRHDLRTSRLDIVRGEQSVRHGDDNRSCNESGNLAGKGSHLTPLVAGRILFAGDWTRALEFLNQFGSHRADRRVIERVRGRAKAP